MIIVLPNMFQQKTFKIWKFSRTFLCFAWSSILFELYSIILIKILNVMSRLIHFINIFSILNNFTYYIECYYNPNITTQTLIKKSIPIAKMYYTMFNRWQTFSIVCPVLAKTTFEIVHSVLNQFELTFKDEKIYKIIFVL